MRTIIKETLEKLHIPTKEFTQQLKKLEKECGGRYRIRLEKETEKVVLAMEIFLTSTQLGIDVAYVKEMVYNSNPDIRL
ncbi:hypothetical protein GW750_05245 [bacterium]|nr:hypothetical protein [bacterium]